MRCTFKERNGLHSFHLFATGKEIDSGKFIANEDNRVFSSTSYPDLGAAFTAYLTLLDQIRSEQRIEVTSFNIDDMTFARLFVEGKKVGHFAPFKHWENENGNVGAMVVSIMENEPIDLVLLVAEKPIISNKGKLNLFKKVLRLDLSGKIEEALPSDINRAYSSLDYEYQSGRTWVCPLIKGMKEAFDVDKAYLISDN